MKMSVNVLKETKSLALYIQQIGRARRLFTKEQIKDFSEFCLYSENYCEGLLELVSIHSIMSNYQVIEIIKSTIINSPTNLERIKDMCIFALSVDKNYKFSTNFFDTISEFFCQGITAKDLMYQLRNFMKKALKNNHEK